MVSYRVGTHHKVCARCLRVQHEADSFSPIASRPGKTRARCKLCERECSAEYRKRASKKARKRRKVQRIRWRKTNAAKYAAQAAVKYALKLGRLKKEPCVKCGSTRVHAHHEAYSRKLDVVWLCPVHHSARHKELRAAGIKL